MRAWLRPAFGAVGVLGVVVAVALPVGRASMASLAVGLLALVLLPARALPRGHDPPSRPSRPPWETAPDVLDLIESREDEEEKRGYSCVGFEFPFLACPRDEFEAILARHEAAIRAQLPAILFLARKSTQARFLRPYASIEMCAAEIDLHGGNEPPRLVVRSSIRTSRRFRSFLSVHHRAAPFPGHNRMRVAVIDDNAVSLRKLELRTEKLPSGAVERELVLVPEAVTFEPVRQELRLEDSTWVRTWQATATSPVHEERIALRPPASTPEEWTDRFFAACASRLRKRAAVAVEDGMALNQFLLWLTPGTEGGPCANVAASTRAGWAPFVIPFARSYRALQRPWPPGWIPVLVTFKEAFGGIRWLSLRPEADPRVRPPSVTEIKDRAVWSAMKRARGW